MKQLICIVCPKGCHLTVDETNGYKVSGNACMRGETYGKKELIDPTRTVTSTAVIKGAGLSRLPVKTNREIPKSMVIQAVSYLNQAVVRAPVHTGEIVCELPGMNACFVATRTLLER